MAGARWPAPAHDAAAAFVSPSPLERREIIDALRIGAVPARGLELFAVGFDRFERAIVAVHGHRSTQGCFVA